MLDFHLRRAARSLVTASTTPSSPCPAWLCGWVRVWVGWWRWFSMIDLLEHPPHQPDINPII